MWSPSGEQVGFSYNNLMDGDVVYETDVGPAPGASGGWTFLTDQPNNWLDWSPDGRRIAYDYGTINPDGTGFTPGPVCGSDMSWAPDNSKLACSRYDGTWNQIYTIRSDGTGLTQISTSPGHKGFPTWSPDGTKIAFTAALHGQSAADVYMMDADGTDVLRVTSTPERELRPDWQPIPINAYPRPKGASPMQVSLVPAYQPCASPNRAHGPPLAFPSCTPPQRTPGQLTIGTADSNQRPTKSVSMVADRRAARQRLHTHRR